MNIKVDARIETRVSKLGKEYTVLVIKICEGIEKLVFVSTAEQKLLELSHN